MDGKQGPVRRGHVWRCALLALMWCFVDVEGVVLRGLQEYHIVENIPDASFNDENVVEPNPLSDGYQAAEGAVEEAADDGAGVAPVKAIDDEVSGVMSVGYEGVEHSARMLRGRRGGSTHPGDDVHGVEGAEGSKTRKRRGANDVEQAEGVEVMEDQSVVHGGGGQEPPPPPPPPTPCPVGCLVWTDGCSMYECDGEGAVVRYEQHTCFWEGIPNCMQSKQ